MDRNSLRRNKLAERNRLDPAERGQKSRQITSALSAHPLITEKNNLFIYVNFRSEVETFDLIRELIATGKTVSVPVTLRKESSLLAVQLTDPENQLAAGCYGIPEPTAARIKAATIDPASIETVLLPGSVFDKNGGRLGYGGGFYDRFLSQAAPAAARVGLAFDLQMVEQVPMQSHDQYMDIIVTEQQIYTCKGKSNA
jgi:5-formyltetrahydrofolate cyclo-ligase